MRTAVQLGINGYGVLGRLPESDLRAALDLVRTGGFDAIEAMSNIGGDPKAVALLREQQTAVAALHLFVSDVEDAADCVKWLDVLSELECGVLVLSGFGMEQSVRGYRALARRLVAVGEELVSHGSNLYYHCHDVELTTLPDGELRGVDVLLEDVTGLRLVIDSYWALAAGADPAGLISDLCHRSGYYHFKDGTSKGGTEFGHGHVDFEGCLRAAQGAEVDWVVLEQDEETSDPAALFDRFNKIIKGSRGTHR